MKSKILFLMLSFLLINGNDVSPLSSNYYDETKQQPIFLSNDPIDTNILESYRNQEGDLAVIFMKESSSTIHLLTSKGVNSEREFKFQDIVKDQQFTSYEGYIDDKESYHFVFQDFENSQITDLSLSTEFVIEKKGLLDDIPNIFDIIDGNDISDYFLFYYDYENKTLNVKLEDNDTPIYSFDSNSVFYIKNLEVVKQDGSAYILFEYKTNNNYTSILIDYDISNLMVKGDIRYLNNTLDNSDAKLMKFNSDINIYSIRTSEGTDNKLKIIPFDNPLNKTMIPFPNIPPNGYLDNSLIDFSNTESIKLISRTQIDRSTPDLYSMIIYEYNFSTSTWSELWKDTEYTISFERTKLGISKIHNSNDDFVYISDGFPVDVADKYNLRENLEIYDDMENIPHGFVLLSEDMTIDTPYNDDLLTEESTPRFIIIGIISSVIILVLFIYFLIKHHRK